MPDLERLTDGLRFHVAKSPEERAFAIGFAKGKSRARIEIAWFVIGIAIGRLAYQIWSVYFHA